jgi:hypothetical protein
MDRLEKEWFDLVCNDPSYICALTFLGSDKEHPET